MSTPVATMIAKAYQFILSVVSPVYRRLRMEESLRKRADALQPSPHEGYLLSPNKRSADEMKKVGIYNSIRNWGLDGTSWEVGHSVEAVGVNKDSGTIANHEYGVVRIRHPNDASAAPFCLKVERIPATEERKEGDELDNEDSSAVTTSVSFKPSCSGSSLSLPHVSALAKGAYPAQDQFHLITGDMANATNLVQFEPATRIDLLDVVILAVTIHHYRPKYTLLEHQCYWFAFALYEILHQVSGAKGDPASQSIEVRVCGGEEPSTSIELPRLNRRHPRQGRLFIKSNNPPAVREDLEAIKAIYLDEIRSARDELERVMTTRRKEEQDRAAFAEVQEQNARRAQVIVEDNEALARQKELIDAALGEVKRLKGEIDAMRTQQG